jgi:hypothetical protein
MNGRVDHVVAIVHFNYDGFLVDAVAQVQLVEDQIQFGWQSLFCLKPRLARGTEEYFRWHDMLLFVSLIGWSLSRRGKTIFLFSLTHDT